MAAGDYLHLQFQHSRKVTDLSILTATTTQTDFILPKSANHRIYVQKIAVSITTYSAVVWTFRDSAGTPVDLALLSIPGAAVALKSETGTIEFDFGPTGTPLTIGEGLTLTISAAGAAGRVHVEAYEKLEGAVALASTN